ncbi:hypothetical protein DLD82_11010 [Methanospirillum stamsii]|uniref:Uncharacterized protein n=1 Tax=Methanospirillum stamsii TaxID=1277351 RepID=A0A2V2N3Y4_9EURY|nr:hypothetical protein DLD82_11010 [Methanospirillum stamsii]
MTKSSNRITVWQLVPISLMGYSHRENVGTRTTSGNNTSFGLMYVSPRYYKELTEFSFGWIIVKSHLVYNTTRHSDGMPKNMNNIFL